MASPAPGHSGRSILTAIQRPNELPVVNVVAFVLILVSVVPVWLAQRISGAETAGARL